MKTFVFIRKDGDSEHDMLVIHAANLEAAQHKLVFDYTLSLVDWKLSDH